MSITAHSGGQRGPVSRVGAIIVAAGQGRRMGGVDKILAKIMGLPLIAHSVRTFNNCPLIGSIVLVLARENIDEGRRLVDENGWHKVRDVCVGGARRQDSVRRGLEKMQDTDWAVVHDGARPCIDAGMIERGLVEARETGAAVAAVPVKDTIKVAARDHIVTDTLSRDSLWAVQTPQVFKTAVLTRAHQHVSKEVTDDASMVEKMGGDVRIFMGSDQNIKVTTSEDIITAEAILKARSAGRTHLGQ